jgi:dTDP-4-amino-4,6-dideoxygalactose transaminase
MIKFLDLQKQYDSIKHDIDNAIAAVIRDAAFIGGKYVKQFEEDFAAYQQAQRCIGVGNGTDALEIAIEALKLPPRSQILVPANSFIASAEAVTRAGHKVVFCDCDPETYTISVDDVRRRVNENTSAIIAVHLYGHPAEMEALLTIAREHHLNVIEDCAQAHGAEYQGKPVGTLGDIGTFSFYPGKNLGAYGDGGAIVTNDEALARTCRMIANHGRLAKYNHEFEGRNSRLDGLQAAILSAKLPYLETWLGIRRTVAQHYRQILQGVAEITVPQEAPWARHVYHLFVVRSSRRDDLQSHLKRYEIQTGIHYPVALPKLPAYRYVDQAKEPMFANTIDDQVLSLPMGEHLSEYDVEYVAEKIRDFTRNSENLRMERILEADERPRKFVPFCNSL